MKNKGKAFIDYITRKEFLALWIFAAVLVVYHIIMREPEASDAMWFFRYQLDSFTMKDYLVTRYETWSSRLLIEAVLVLVSRNMFLWKILDSICWVFLAWGLIWLFPEKYREKVSYLVVGCLLIYPMWDLRTAGWIATSVNYTWPLAFGVFSLHGTVRAFFKQKTPAYLWPLYAVAALYGANMEQMAAILLTANLCVVVYCIIEKTSIRIYGTALMGMVIAAAEFVFILTCPGNGARKNQETINWMPNFGSFHLLDKVDMGFSDTMHHLIASGNLIYLCYVSLLAVFVFLKTKDVKYRLAALFPPALNLCMLGFQDMFNTYFPEFYKLMKNNTMIRGNNYQAAANYLPTVLYLALIGCMLMSIMVVCESWLELAGQGILLALGLASRVIMGFTPTIYVSQERTFFYLYLILGVSGICLILKNSRLLQEHAKVYETMKLLFFLFAVIGVILNLSEIGSV